MTSDAKVGLLLGLAFIFIIAFIINGLPSFKQQQDTNELTRNMAKPHQVPPGIGTNARKINREVIERIEPVEQTPVAGQTSTEQMTQPDSESVRFQTELPSVSAQSNTSEVSNVQSVSNVQLASNVQPASGEPRQTNESTFKPRDNQNSKPVTYTVKEGDSLADIAKSIYGPEEGNKRANVDRIFQANQKSLKSPDQIYVGQKLIVPPLTENLQKSQEAASVLPADKFQHMESIGRQNLLKTTEARIPQIQTTEKKDSTKYYTVKDGDHLWSIAAQQLGNGNRYKEIARLNKGILKDEDHLEVGMRLKLPPR